MAFNPKTKEKIVRVRKIKEHLHCVMCGSRYPLPDAVHIIDEKEWRSRDKDGHNRQENGIPLCPNCHRIFDEVLRPKLYAALTRFGSTNLPVCWMKNNKQSDHEPVSDQDLG
jgi:hypothetical protein